MRRKLILAVVVGLGFLILRARHGPKLHERVIARCEAMFEGMPNDFPPKRMMRGIDEIRATTARILELLERESVVHEPPVAAASSTEGMRTTA